MKFQFISGEEIDRGVVLFSLSNLYRVPGLQKRFLLQEFTNLRILPLQTTVLPRIRKTFTYDFIDELATAELNVPALCKGHEHVFFRYEEFLDTTNGVSSRELRQAKEAWHKVEKDFVQVLTLLFEQVEEKVEHVTVYVTHYGHAGSYCYHKNGKMIAVYWNIASPLLTIGAMVIQALVHLYNYQKWLRKEPAFMKSGLWHNKVSIATVLANLPLMTRIFGDKIDSSWLFKDVTQTPAMVEKLRLTANVCDIELSNPIEINGITISGLTQSEDALLRTLAENRGRYVSSSTIAKTLWHENASSKFSIYYFPKLVFTLRKKLDAVGINSRLIRSQSGAGYYIE
ncbi:hypothetical protein CO112_01385 [Candidatus Dojkabacteria bacterium CG_4_9_14_3_um_filter_150_Dojkabacteria_WS6_41_13]|uniref:OmpR/PhoB-type domain-containing protein n=1 Tax=Candidatus Dojkabacteria bacterium CG_4_10_14_0_2_um_filter_Dojkabacteria_WS6_41_15 TaxID=2014249 RepID=A0A2M7W272_9BACT|nr:MAG: hypothetical protein COZ14_01780 [Candidatus Dojkabacteria bacterium CG_4_10_14_3_um_filter_Dojkabacteria_WS6_41_9]PJA14410.1 MAG: hypothetical protein COX64_02015 [Candidatus Dojkabacteria bacterium CG_4_10_14_0_2_um_filter_Dojkabacteria_WS6_41_15]PJB23238.1 MAG: hypothetical protein CO112_01385 [Candidatus Dojkabacteria bacterium CG_4_9_14_3_um_filter_150_Dojkabacteria_WS6_41_13]